MYMYMYMYMYIEGCISDIDLWISADHLKFNADTTKWSCSTTWCDDCSITWSGHVPCECL